jgi:hypothetical protein
MAKVNITEAIKLSGVSRQTFYAKYIDQGRITVETGAKGKKCIDTAELIRAFGTIDLDRLDNADRQDQTGQLDSKTAMLETEVKLLREQLNQAQEREQDARKREEWLQGQVDKLAQTVKLLEHKPEIQTGKKKGFLARLLGMG